MTLQEIFKDFYTQRLDKHETNIINQVMHNESFDIINQPKLEQVRNVAFVVGNIVKHSGGHTSMLRLGTGLQERGISVSYISYNNQNVEEMKNIAIYNLAKVQGSFFKYKDVKSNRFDVVIATSWQSVYYAKKLTGYKVYFVQDFEPYFFKLNERYLLAKKTYELGLHIISLGTWNLEQISRFCQIDTNCKLDSINFPYEPNEYKKVNRNYYDYNKKTKISIAVYSKEDGKRIPNMIQNILLNTANELLEHNIQLNIKFFGFKPNKKLIVGTNLGKLNKVEMNSLYNEVDFGMVASMSNISLVPYEMLATGLPLIEFKDGSFPYFFDDKSAIITDYNYKSLVNEILNHIKNPMLIEEKMKNSENYLKNLSWSLSCDQFLSILDGARCN